MKSIPILAETIKYISQPAFTVKDGVVTAVNESASRMQIQIGSFVNELIKTGIDDYAEFKSGKLCLELKIGRAWVSALEETHLFYIEDAYPSPELRALALASQHLRAPLSNAMSSIELMRQNEALNESEALKQQLSSMSRSIYEMMRSVCNMSDASPAELSCKANMQLQNAASVFAEIFEKLTEYAEASGRTLKFTGLSKKVICAIDYQLMERAILNTISNAIKYSPVGSTIRAKLKLNGNRLSLTVENTLTKMYSGIFNSAFQQFHRAPAIEDGLSGIGLGMTIISGILFAHSGTLLLDNPRKNTARITLSFPVRTTVDPVMRSPIRLLGGYTGGIDSYLVELADVLPSHCYE